MIRALPEKNCTHANEIARQWLDGTVNARLKNCCEVVLMLISLADDC
jgi:hypothetical protein